MPLPAVIPLLASAAPGAFKLFKGLSQKKDAKNLKESKFIPPELLMNRDLAAQQAYSRRSPGAALAEEQVRRNTANQVGNAMRMFGGDANKIAAVSSAANAQANDAVRGIQAQGQAFSEGAFQRLAGANVGIANQKRQNRNEFNATKAALLDAGNQNIFGGISDLSSAAVFGADSGLFGSGAKKNAESMLKAKYPWLYNQNGGNYQQNPNYGRSE
jgi:hypothetical protein